MIIPLKFYNDLRQEVKISDVVRQKTSLIKKGAEYLGICPFHNEKTPSFTVNDIKKFYHCFGCGAHGDVIKFVAETNGLSYKEASKKIALDNSIKLPTMSVVQTKDYEETEQIYNILKIASAYFREQITDEVEKYLLKRNITNKIKEQFSIGYAPGKGSLIQYFTKKKISLKLLLKSGLVGKKEDGSVYELFNKRVIFPIKNVYNQIIGFGGRVTDNSLPKYINSSETLVFKKSETMYGENIATSAVHKKNYSIIVEGYMDVIALNTVGINEAVASLGTSVTVKHLQKLWRSGDEIIICLDGDKAGKRASDRLIEIALPMISPDKKISFINLPKSQDPDDIIKSGGGELFHKLLSEKIHLSKAIWINEFRNKDFPSAESKAEVERKLEIVCGQIKDKLLANSFRYYFKDQAWRNFYSGSRQVKNSGSESFTKSCITKNNNEKKYTEIEVMQLSLWGFAIKFPYILKKTTVKDFFSDLVLPNDNFSEFKDWFICQIYKYDNINEDKIINLIKNTRFYKSFLVLSNPKENFLDSIFIERNKNHYKLIFDLLNKKYYLLLLKQEYVTILNSTSEEISLKAPSYLKEIQKTSEELNKLNEFFMN